MLLALAYHRATREKKGMKQTTNPYLKADGDRLRVTKKGQDYLNEIVTDSKGPVYAFYGKASPLMIAAAMARLSRRGSDLREIYLDEFAVAGEKDASGLIHRVVTAYGDDSVQQLVGMHLVVEDASNILTKLLEWGRFGAYLEQSTRYIYFDQKNANGKYRYYVPENLNKKIKEEYCKTLDEVFDLYSAMVRKATDYVREKSGEPEEEREKMAWKGATRAQACDAIRPTLPVATTATVGIFGSSQAIESLILHLLAEDLLEARQAGERILAEARKVIPAFLERTDKPERGGATTAHRANTRSEIKQLAQKYTGKIAPKFTEEVRLLDYSPKNELDVVPHILFSESNSSFTEIKKEAGKVSDTQKKKIIQTYMGERLNRRHKPGRAMEIPHYLWEITTDYGIFRDLQRHRVVDAFEWQHLGIDLGYEIPKLVKDAGLVDEFKKCFELSEKLYLKMQKAGYENEAQYVSLFGHRMRFRIGLNARAAFHFVELRSAPQGHPGYRRVAAKMHEQLTKVHPEIGKSMRFVNKDEDPALTRMAAELATQYKLEHLDKNSKKK
jgi:thymidylate synthase ThyX